MRASVTRATLRSLCNKRTRTAALPSCARPLSLSFCACAREAERRLPVRRSKAARAQRRKGKLCAQWGKEAQQVKVAHARGFQRSCSTTQFARAGNASREKPCVHVGDGRFLCVSRAAQAPQEYCRKRAGESSAEEFLLTLLPSPGRQSQRSQECTKASAVCQCGTAHSHVKLSRLCVRLCCTKQNNTTQRSLTLFAWLLSRCCCLASSYSLLCVSLVPLAVFI